MSGDERLTRLFLEACDLAPQEQARFLERECAGDPRLGRELAELLAEDRRGHAELERPAAAHLRRSAPAHPERLGGYRILRQLGAGGMGVVYEAEQQRPRRRVALKVVRPGLASLTHLERFEHEAEVLGWLDHPGIARIYEAGTADAGHGPQPFFAMELVDGAPLCAWAEREGLDVGRRLELLARVCDAVHHAHQKGVVHRDLKPANVLVTAEGQPKVLDFGVARIAGSELDTATQRTSAGEILGTLPYMSPEQVRADPSRVDLRSDVYALGVLAYELLSRRRPHEVGSTPLPEAIRVILHDEPTSLASIDRRLRGDVATIVDKAMAKERERRYGSAAELAADIRRYLADEPILARPASRAYQLRKFARRHTALVTGVAAVIAVLLAGAITSTLLYFEKERQRVAAEDRGRELGIALEQATDNLQRALQAEERARYEADSAQAVTDYLVELFEAASPARGGSGQISALELVDQGVARVRGEFQERPKIRARLLNVFGRIYNFSYLYDRSRPVLEEALAVTAEVWGEDSAEYADTLERVAHVHHEAGDLGPAEEMQRRVLELRARHLGEGHLLYTDALNNLGNTLATKGDYDGAEKLLRRALDLRVQEVGADHFEVAQALHNLGVLRSYQARYEESVELLTTALTGLARHYGEATLRPLACRVALADAQRQLGRHAQALEHGRAGYEGLRDLLGEDSVQVRRALRIYAGCLRDAGDPERAVGMLDGLLLRQPGDGAEHAMLVHLLACALHDAGRPAEAEEHYLEALGLMNRFVADPHRALETKHNLAVVYQETDRLDEALELELEVLAERERLLPPGHPDLEGSRTNLSRIQGKLRR